MTRWTTKHRLPCTALQDGWTPLLVASGKGHLQVVRLLLAQGADKEAIFNQVGAVHLKPNGCMWHPL